MNEDTIRKVRVFNRYYTMWLEVMNKGYLGTKLSWPESRVLFEIYLHNGINATELCGHLNMDKSYASRLLAGLEKGGLVKRELVSGSKGIKKLCLTEAGIKEAKQIDMRGDEQIAEKLSTLDEADCDRLCEAMAQIEKILSEKT